MEADDDDDIYASGGNERVAQPTDTSGLATNSRQVDDGQKPADLEEGEEEDEDEEEESDSDIDIITERKDEPKPEPIALNPAEKRPPPLQSQERPTLVSEHHRSMSTQGRSMLPLGNLSPRWIWMQVGLLLATFECYKLIQAYIDFSEDDKPWRRPGTDLTDFFNYGFDEFTWASYCLKQDTLRKEVTGTKKQMEDMQNFMNMPGGMPPIPGMPTAPSGQGAVPAMPGMEGIPQELQQMMQQMISQGMDPTQISPEMMMQMMTGQGGATGNPSQSQGQSFGGGQNFGQQNQNQGFGYGAGGGRGGRGGRRW
ncbi:MAG: hypothetical protein LQ339_004276 [Xanthoria mediterranea]|nr:MAG: hypothetical protein LQ339_004276 [Xanthoria mediterranea]